MDANALVSSSVGFIQALQIIFSLQISQNSLLSVLDLFVQILTARRSEEGYIQLRYHINQLSKHKGISSMGLIKTALVVGGGIYAVKAVTK